MTPPADRNAAMPRIKNACFHCQICGEPTRVLRTRQDRRGAIVRYRACLADATHRTTTRETVAGGSLVAECDSHHRKIIELLLSTLKIFGVAPNEIASAADAATMPATTDRPETEN